MKKDPNKYPKGWNAAKVRRVLDCYENQTDDEGAQEIEKALEVEPMTWIKVPTHLVPKVTKLVDRDRTSA